jgi:hypothetical protein
MKIDVENLINNDLGAMIEFVDIEESKLNSPIFIEKKSLLKNLINSNESSIPLETRDENNSKEEDVDYLNLISDKVIITNWKNIENISARLIENCGENIVLECLIDKENSIYEERIFETSLFEGYNIEIGSLFYLRFFKRKNEAKMEVHEGKGIVLEEDFPKLNFKEIFSSSKLFK